MSDTANCPKCAGPMFDERKSKFWNGGKTKTGANKPIFKCRDKTCDGCIWPPREGTSPAPQANATRSAPHNASPGFPYDINHTGDPLLDADLRLAQDAMAAHKVPAPAPLAVPPLSERLDKMFQLYDVCFAHATAVAIRANGLNPDVAAMAATLFIAARERGLAA